MRRSIRNPRFAPECLESRLSPSSLTGTDLASTSAYVDYTTLGSGGTGKGLGGIGHARTPAAKARRIIIAAHRSARRSPA